MFQVECFTFHVLYFLFSRLGRSYLNLSPFDFILPVLFSIPFYLFSFFTFFGCYLLKHSSLSYKIAAFNKRQVKFNSLRLSNLHKICRAVTLIQLFYLRIACFSFWFCVHFDSLFFCLSEEMLRMLRTEFDGTSDQEWGERFLKTIGRFHKTTFSKENFVSEGSKHIWRIPPRICF